LFLAEGVLDGKSMENPMENDDLWKNNEKSYEKYG